MISFKLYFITIFILTLGIASANSANLQLHKGAEKNICSAIFSNSLRPEFKSLHESIKLAGGNYNYVKWLPLKGNAQISSYNLEYAMMDFDNNGKKEPVVKGFIGCSGYQRFYRVLNDHQLADDGVTNLNVSDIWSRNGVGWCFNAQYQHYGLPGSFDLRSFEYKDTIYLTLESYKFGQKDFEKNSFLVAKYTGIMNKPKVQEDAKIPTDKLDVTCQFSYSEK
jgi:hypothetical protein